MDTSGVGGQSHAAVEAERLQDQQEPSITALPTNTLGLHPAHRERHNPLRNGRDLSGYALDARNDVVRLCNALDRERRLHAEDNRTREGNEMRPVSLVLTDDEIANFGRGGYPDWGRVRATLQHLQSKWQFEHELALDQEAEIERLDAEIDSLRRDLEDDGTHADLPSYVVPLADPLLGSIEKHR
jgi:hypothetical protein